MVDDLLGLLAGVVTPDGGRALSADEMAVLEREQVSVYAIIGSTTSVGRSGGTPAFRPMGRLLAR